MGQLTIVNAPASFTFIWSIIKPWLSKETAEKVDILGSDYQEVLLDLIDKENLPTILGGACECEGGCDRSFAGPWKESTEERRERRNREACLGSVNGVSPSTGGTPEEKQVIPAAVPVESCNSVAADEHIGNGEVVTPSSPSTDI